ncbi:MAG: hypothetical protein H3C49_08835, partial [Alphaproteobacteria bacterium]|nr:hypothetical protein [Alphaproteobacteria bacterium]
MSSSKYVNYEPPPGTTINYAAEEAIKLARETSKPVQFQFNSASLTVDAQSKPADVVKDYKRQLDAEIE